MNLSLIEYQSSYSGSDLAQPAGPSLSEQLTAQFKLENIAGSTYTTYKDRPFAGFEEDPEWNPAVYMDENFGDLEDEEYLHKWSLIHDTNSEADANSRLRIDEEYKEARRVRDTMGTWTSLWTGAIAGITDPITLATLAVPLTSGVGAARTAAKLGSLVAAESTAIEGVLHSQQDDRTLTESALNITANAVLGGVLGGIGGKLNSNSIDRAANAEAIKKGLSDDAVDIGEINSDLGTSYKDLNELKADLEKSDLLGVSAVRFSNADHLNSTIRSATNKYSMTVRRVAQQLASNSFLTRASKEGDVGTSSMAGASTAIETATNRFSGRQHRILLEASKEWRKANPATIGDKFKRGWDDYLEDVGKKFRTYDPEDSTLAPWERDLFKQLTKIQEEYESLLSRKGFIDELEYVGIAKVKKNKDTGKLEITQSAKKVIDEERTAKNLAKYEALKAKAKTEKTRQRYSDEVEMHKDWLSLIKRYKSGDQSAAREILERMHGEKRYTTQSHNKTAIQENKEGWFQAVERSEKSWYTNQINKYGKDTAYGRKYKRDMDALFKDAAAYRARLEDIYTEIQKNNDPLALGGFDNAMGSSASMSKARVLKIDQTMMTDFLRNNFMDLQNAHYSSVLPRLELKSRGLDKKSLKEVEKKIVAEYELHKQSATSAKEINAIDVDMRKALADIRKDVDLILGEQYKNITQLARDSAFLISQFNSTRQLGAMLIASTNDLPGVIAKTGLKNIAKAIIPGLKGFRNVVNNATKKELREMVGIVEMVSASRVHALNSSAELGINQSAWARGMGRLSKRFYQASGILWWNQGVKEIAILGFSDGILKANPAKMSRKDLAWFARDGIDIAKLNQIQDLFKRYPVENEYGSAVINTGKIYEKFAKSTGDAQILADAKLADEWNALLTKHANRTVVTPETGDLPSFITRHPMLKLIGQYKGFGSASINKTMVPMMQGIAQGDAHMAFGFLGMTAMGTGVYMMRQALYDREVSENWETLAYEGLLRGGALGLYSDGLAVSQKMTNNWLGLGDVLNIETPSRYYARSFITDVGGPTVGMLEDIASVTYAGSSWLKGEELSESDKARGVRMIPFNNLFYLRAVLENWDKF